MNILKNVVNKIAESDKKTVLASEKVELAIIDDLKKYSDVAKRANNTIDSEAKEVKKLQNQIRTVLANVNASKSALEDILADAKSDINKFEGMAKDLGIKPEGSKEYNNAKKAIKDIESSIKQAEQVYKSGQKNFA